MRLVVCNGVLSKNVLANLGDHGTACTQLCSHHTLVCALSTKSFLRNVQGKVSLKTAKERGAKGEQRETFVLIV